MKILLVSPLPPPVGGIATWTNMMVAHSLKVGDELKVIDISSKRESVVGRGILKRIFDGIITTSRAFRKIRKEIKTQPADVTHIATSGDLSFLRDYVLLRFLKRNGIRCVYHLRFGKIPNLKRLNNWKWKLFLKNSRLADAVIAIDERTYQALTDVIEEGKLHALANPVDFSRLPAPIEYDEHKNYIFYLGWVIKGKGIEELLLVWQRLKNELTDWKIKIAGPVNAEFKDYLENKGLLKDVELLMELSHEDAMEYMKMAGIFVLPSHTEGFPNVILEAMAMKTPAVATKVGAIPQMIEEEKYLLDVGDCARLEEILKNLAGSLDDRREISNRLYKKAVDEYAIDIIYEKYKNIWEREKA